MGSSQTALRILLLILACSPLISASNQIHADAFDWDLKSNRPRDLCPAKTRHFKQQLDHFGFSEKRTFQERYLIATQFWNKNGGPIFFYTGNELDIELLCKNTGFMWEIAPEFGAMVVFAEHRYYGKTLPLGADTFKNMSNFNWLTTEQALADYAVLITHLKSTIPGASKSPVIAFGGSYGAMLSAYMRITYPNVVIGAHSGSAPFYMLSAMADCKGLLGVTSQTFKKASPQCAKNIRESWDAFTAVFVKDHDFIPKTFNLCQPVKNAQDLLLFKVMIANTYFNYAMMDYPYPSNLIINLPGWPVNAACDLISEPLDGKDLVRGISKVINLYYNYTGGLHCLDWKNPPGGLEFFQFAYQICTEMVIPVCSDGSGMFFKFPWSWKVFSDACQSRYKVRPRPYWNLLHYRMTQLETTSNIIFTNGDLDPCSSGGIKKNVTDSVIAINIENAAHHLELRYANKLDPPSVITAREQIKAIFRNWLKV